MNSMWVIIFLSMLTTISVENTLFKILFSCLTIAFGIFYVRKLDQYKKAEKK